MVRRSAQSRRLLPLVSVSTVLALFAAGCAVTPPTPTASATALGTLAYVEPTVISGLESSVTENLKAGRYTYISLPKVPGAEAWLTQLRADLEPQLKRFVELAPSRPTPPYPEMAVNWEIVGASESTVGVRLITEELGSDRTFSGKVSINWWDHAIGAERPSSDLIAPGATPEFFRRLRAAIQADPNFDLQMFESQLDAQWKGLDSVGFTNTGAVWVEFDRTKISQLETNAGVAVSSDGLLSTFGEQARAAAMNPRDPKWGQATPTPTSVKPSPSVTKPSPSSTTPSPAKPTASSSTTAKPSPTQTGSTVNCAKLKCVALTFDDGPVPGTAQLLDVLKEKGVHATFFMVGSNAAMHPDLVRRMAKEGHVIGNHTWDHPQLTRRSAADIRSELTRTNNAIVKAGAPRPTLLRPPYGATNATVAGVAAELGMAQILWSVDPMDWKDRNSAIVTKRVLSSVRRGSIVLSHDIHPTTRKAYAGIIDGLRAKGYTLVTVPELLGTTKPGHKYFHG